jgi:hypothetical protein
MFQKKLPIYIFLFVSKSSFSQLSVITVQNDSLQKKITVDFKQPKIIFNLLLRLNDEKGTTFFFDNKYKFSGHYFKQIDVSKIKKGNYKLEVIRDDEHFLEDIFLK